MLKLKALKEQKAAAAKAEAAKAGGDGGGAASGGAGDGGEASGGGAKSGEKYVLKRSNSKELEEKRTAKPKDNVFTLGKKNAKGGGGGKSRSSPSELRAQKDIAEMAPVPGCTLDFPDPNNLMSFTVDITPSDGLYAKATFHFTIKVPTNYPYDPPKCLCTTPIWHPNIDQEGKICLNILRADWMPVLNLGSVVFGLLTLFLEPNPDDPLNKEAAKQMVERRAEFESTVKKTLRGGFFNGRQYPKLLS